MMNWLLRLWRKIGGGKQTRPVPTPASPTYQRSNLHGHIRGR